MFIDHVHEMFAPVVPDWLDIVGRPVAVMFMFISVEGFVHTRNRQKYMMRLLIGFWVMNIGSQIVQQFFSLGNFALMNNIFGTLFLGVLTMYGISFIETGVHDHSSGKMIKGIGIVLLPLVWTAIQMGLMAVIPNSIYLVFAIPSVTAVESGVLLYIAPLLYLLRKKRVWQMAGIAVVGLAILMLDPSHAFTTNTEWLLILAIPILWLYNGNKGKSMRNFFYVFYPTHIWLLYVVASLMGIRF